VQCIGQGSVPFLAEVRLGSAFTSGSSVYSIWISITPLRPTHHVAMPGLQPQAVGLGEKAMADGPSVKRPRTEAAVLPDAAFGRDCGGGGSRQGAYHHGAVFWRKGVGVGEVA
jgi:hypothetical protein